MAPTTGGSDSEHLRDSFFFPPHCSGVSCFGAQVQGAWVSIVVAYGLYGEGNGTPLQYSCLEHPMDGGAWWAAVHRVAKSRT